MARIKTDRELKVSKQKLKEIQASIKKAKKMETKKVLEKAGFFGVQSFGQDIDFEVKEYESLKVLWLGSWGCHQLRSVEMKEMSIMGSVLRGFFKFLIYWGIKLRLKRRSNLSLLLKFL